MDKNAFSIAIATASVFASQSAAAQYAECYDVKVAATVLEQIPSPAPRSDEPDVILYSWPWFVDMRVEDVLEGDHELAITTVMTIQHTYVLWFGVREFDLRRNELGSYNLVYPREGVEDQYGRCAEGTPLARPYLTPGADRTLTEIRDEGFELYGSWAERYAGEFE